MVQLQTRDQCHLELCRINAQTGCKTILLTESTKIWINLHDLLYTFSRTWKPKAFRNYTTLNENDFYFIWASERSGYRQLYLYYYDCIENKIDCLRHIGPEGNYVVDDICDVDEENEIIYFHSNFASPLTQHLYKASFSMMNDTGCWFSLDGDIQQITQEEGWHATTVNAKLGYYLDVYTSVTQPAIARLCSLHDKNKQYILYDHTNHPFVTNLKNNLKIPEFKTIRSEDNGVGNNSVDLFCVSYVPDKAIFGVGPFPCIVSVYCGPHVQRVYNQWTVTADLR